MARVRICVILLVFVSACCTDHGNSTELKADSVPEVNLEEAYSNGNSRELQEYFTSPEAEEAYNDEVLWMRRVWVQCVLSLLTFKVMACCITRRLEKAVTAAYYEGKKTRMMMILTIATIIVFVNVWVNIIITALTLSEESDDEAFTAASVISLALSLLVFFAYVGLWVRHQKKIFGAGADPNSGDPKTNEDPETNGVPETKEVPETNEDPENNFKESEDPKTSEVPVTNGDIDNIGKESGA